MLKEVDRVDEGGVESEGGWGGGAEGGGEVHCRQSST